MTIKDLKPTEVFGIFHEITQVPRPSKKEEKNPSVRARLCSKAQSESKS